MILIEVILPCAFDSNHTSYLLSSEYIPARKGLNCLRVLYLDQKLTFKACKRNFFKDVTGMLDETDLLYRCIGRK